MLLFVLFTASVAHAASPAQPSRLDSIEARCTRLSAIRTLTSYRVDQTVKAECMAQMYEQQRQDELDQAIIDNLNADTKFKEEATRNLKYNRRNR